MFDYIQFTVSEGDISTKDLRLFTLSTCSFCAEAMGYLKENNLRFAWVSTDELPLAIRRKLRNEFIRTFRKRIYYPTLVVDGRKVLSGFEAEEWQEELELKND